MLQRPGAGRSCPTFLRWRVRIRLIRQQVLARFPPFGLSVVLDESVLHRQVGGRAFMNEQLPRLSMRAVEQKWQTIRFALESWSRTARLCVIMLVMSVPVDTLAWLVLRR